VPPYRSHFHIDWPGLRNGPPRWEASDKPPDTGYDFTVYGIHEVAVHIQHRNECSSITSLDSNGSKLFLRKTAVKSNTGNRSSL